MRTLFLATILLLSSASAPAQTIAELFDQCTEAYNAKNYDRFLTLVTKLDSIRPSNPRITYNLAAAYALKGEYVNAKAILEKLIMMNNTLDFERDEDFASLREDSGYISLLDLKLELSEPVANSTRAIQLDDNLLHPEGILFLPKKNTWLATGVHKHKIVSFDIKAGFCNDWLVDPTVLAVFSIKADPNEKYLWAATAAIPEMDGYDEETMKGKAEVLKIDIKTQKIIKRYPLAGGHVFGDILVASNGDVYISDSGKPIIFRIPAKQDKLTEWLNLEKEAFNLQGLAFNQDESALFVADYLMGILKISMADNSEHGWLEFPSGGTHKGIDGIAYFNNSLIAIHNGTTPMRVMQYELAPDQNELVKAVTIDRARPEFAEPTLPYLLDGTLYFVANCPWGAYSKNGFMIAEKAQMPLIYKYVLK